jgi:ADP-ribosylglycohydrolase
MTLDVTHMVQAVDQYLVDHGTWPARLFVPIDQWTRALGEADAIPMDPESPLPCILAAVSLLPGTANGYRGGDTTDRPIVSRPIPDSYVTHGGAVAAGAYPGSAPRDERNAAAAKLAAHLEAGITAFIDLTGPADHLAEYADEVQRMAAARGVDITHQRCHIPDMKTCDAAQMNAILDAIDRAVAERHGVYVHCWGGVGRTGMVIGCWLVRHGATGEAALSEVLSLFRTMSAEKWERHKEWGSPQTPEQREVVRGWAEHDTLRRAMQVWTGFVPSRPHVHTAVGMAVRAVSTRTAHRIDPTDEHTLLVSRAGITWRCTVSFDDTTHRLRIVAAACRDEAGTTTRSMDHIAETAPLTAYPAPAEIETLLDQVLADAATVRDKMRGALIGLAVGDAVGTTVEFMTPGSFAPVTDMTGGGPFNLGAGDWTDDTSMALCLAESLTEQGAFDAMDQMQRYCRWWNSGHLSSTGRCFDIGTTTVAALRRFERTGDPFAGSTEATAAGNGSLMRLAPIPVYYFGRDDDAIARAAESSRTTHGAAVAIDACRYFAALITGALQGADKDALLSPRYSPTPGYWNSAPLHPVIAAIADGSFKAKEPPVIRAAGYVADSLEAALWAFHRSSDFREGCLLAANLGDDADTVAAIFGQIAGAYYGESGIPVAWRERLTKKSLIDHLAEQLCVRIPTSGSSGRDRTSGSLFDE